jgi:tRNA/rRNA methyltransferase
MSNNSSPVIILARPQLGENIGTAARAMLNFGFTSLRIVNPRDGWPNEAALYTAVGASHIIENAQIFTEFEEAISDLELIFATTSRRRDLNKSIISAENLYEDVLTSEISPRKIGIVFGAERSGLENDELVWANKLVSIEVNENFTSMNLAAAVAIVCYELRKINNANRIIDTPKRNNEIASQKEILNFFDHLEQVLDKTNFYQVYEKKPTMLHNIKNIFKRVDKITSKEINTLIGIFKAMENNSQNMD